MTALKTLAMVNHDHTLTVNMPQCGVAEGRCEVVGRDRADTARNR